ncbi:MAG: nucleotidyltransferase family protein [Haliscomenobacter sp.]|nr:nucleotidyltransferase family protein [Haliscomenobacter sp.]MBK9487830.1 nucleotidyltransferase family protein [Haliscomenobacter sp.]
MRAMIFAAGLGTRLRPITDALPKALVPIKGHPLLEIAILRLKAAGCRDIIVNIHHFGQQIIDFLQRNDHFGINIQVSDERDLLLDTGGGLKKAAWFLRDEPFLLTNADAITNLDLHKFYQTHLKNDALATLAVRQRESSRYFLFNPTGQLCGWRNEKTGETRLSRAEDNLQHLCFSGIHAISPRIFDFFPEDQSVFSIIDTYLSTSATERILAYPHDEDIWMDVGKIPQLEQAEGVLEQVLPKV